MHIISENNISSYPISLLYTNFSNQKGRCHLSFLLTKINFYLLCNLKLSDIILIHEQQSEIITDLSVEGLISWNGNHTDYFPCDKDIKQMEVLSVGSGIMEESE